MPEGPEVRVIADNIIKGIGDTFHSADFTRQQQYKWGREGVPGWSLLQGKSWKLDKISTKGKLIRLDLKNPQSDISVLSTLGLEGFWSWDPENKYARIWFDFTQGRLVYSDSRNFGTLRIMEPKDADKKMAKIGHDLLVEPMDSEKWSKLQDDKSLNQKPIGEVLMKQNKFSGIGNIYKAEVLYELKINPTHIVGNLNKQTWTQINHQSHKILQTSYQLKGSSVKSYNGGQFQRTLKVYKKKKCPLGHFISSTEQAKRTTWYCPTCQP